MRCNKIQLFVVAADADVAVAAAAHATPAVCLICRVFLLGIFWVFLFCFCTCICNCCCFCARQPRLLGQAFGSLVSIFFLINAPQVWEASTSHLHVSVCVRVCLSVCVGSEIRSDICMCSGLNGFIFTRKSIRNFYDNFKKLI